MVFTVTYRAKDGALREERIEAASRAGCMAECRRRGIAPKGIREGGKGKGRDGARPSRVEAGGDGKRTTARWVAAAVVVAAVAGGAWWLFGGRDGARPSQAEASAKPKAAAVRDGTGKTAPATGAVAPAAARRDARPAVDTRPSQDALPPGDGDSVAAVTNAPPTNRVEWIVPPLEPDDPDNALRTRTAQELGSLLSVTPGDPIPPFPYSFLVEDDQKKSGQPADNGNNAFLESLRKLQIRAKETDSKSLTKHKEDIVTAQMDLLDGIKEGLSVNDTIRAAYEFRVRAHEYRNSAITALREWAAENPTRADFDKALADLNAKLAEEGIKTIPAEEVVPELEEEVQETKENNP